jgi:aromatic-L-amino-acid decarboxylase
VNASGQAFMIHTVLHVRVVLRLAIGNVRTTEDHVMATWALLPKIADDFR